MLIYSKKQKMKTSFPKKWKYYIVTIQSAKLLKKNNLNANLQQKNKKMKTSFPKKWNYYIVTIQSAKLPTEK
jgi:hypothetical protein